MQELRARLSFDIERLRVASHRLERVDRDLGDLKRRLEDRARAIAELATRRRLPELNGVQAVHVLYAQAHAIAHLARHAGLGEVLQSSERLGLVASMAINRWVHTLQGLRTAPARSSVLRGHIEAGRIVHRTLLTLKPEAGLRKGCGKLTSALVLAEFVHPTHRIRVEGWVESGFRRAQRLRDMKTDQDVIQAVSTTIRFGASLLEKMIQRAEPARVALEDEAASIETKVQTELSFAG